MHTVEFKLHTYTYTFKMTYIYTYGVKNMHTHNFPFKKYGCCPFGVGTALFIYIRMPAFSLLPFCLLATCHAGHELVL